MSDDEFKLEARRLIRMKIEDRSERIKAVGLLIEKYVDGGGLTHDCDVLDSLSDYILQDELSDTDSHKTRRECYPFISKRQIKTRYKREIPLEYVFGVASCGVLNVFYDTNETRLKNEIEREYGVYRRLNRRQRVHTRKANADDLSRIIPHPYASFRGREHVTWSLDVRRRDDFTCQKCGKRNRSGMHAHHIEAYDTAIELRTDTYNGVTLCGPCHMDFHAIYGRGGNDRFQLIEWMADSYYEFHTEGERISDDDVRSGVKTGDNGNRAGA